MQQKQIVSLILLLLSANITVSAQKLTGTFADQSISGKTIVLSEVWGDETQKLDSTRISNNGTFEITLQGLERGFYELSLNDSTKAEFLLNPEEAEIDLFFGRLDDLTSGMTVEKSMENKLFNQWMVKKQYLTSEIRELNKKRKKVSKKNKGLRQKYTNSIDSIRVVRHDYLEDMVNDYPNTAFAKFHQPYILPKYVAGQADSKGKTYDSKQAFHTAHFFDNVDFHDNELMRSHVFPDRIFEYFKYYTKMDPINFYRSTDKIMDLSAGSDEIKQFCLKSLLHMFNEKGPKYAFQYAVEEYLFSGSCGDVELEDGLQLLADVYESLLPGNKIPNAIMPSTEGGNLDISQVAAKNLGTVLFFWSSHCKYCKAALPELKEMYNEYKDQQIEFIGIAIENNKDVWTNSVKNYGIEWLNGSELKGWKGQATKDYKVHKTPYYYFLAHDMTIISKPKNQHELKTDIEKLVAN